MSKFWQSLIIALLASIISIYLHTLPPARAKLTPQLEQSQRLNLAIELIQEGKQSYDRGQFTAAENSISEAFKIYQVAGQQLEQIQTLSLLSLVYEKLGQWQQAEETLNLCLSLLQKVPNSNDRDRVLAQVLNRKGRWQLARGDANAAIITAQTAESLYTQLNNSTGKIGSKINQAQAWQALGFYRRAEKILTSVEQELRAQKPSPVKVSSLQNLGNLLRQKGDLKRSEQILEESFKLAQNLKLSSETSQILLNLGNNKHNLALITNNIQDANQRRVYNQQALKYYQQAELKATVPLTIIKAQLNQLSIHIETKQLSSAKKIIWPIAEELNKLAPSRESIYSCINFAQNLMQLESELDIASILNKAIEHAEYLHDLRAKSYALGTLGQFYEHLRNWTSAKQFTESALLIANNIDAPDLRYRWEWQLGRLLENQQAIPDAIAAYTEAVKDLQLLRNDLVTINPDVQFSFREEVEPVYRQLVNLLLRSDKTTKPSQSNLQKARNILESLQLAELENFFRSACLEAKVDIERVIEQESPNTAVIYPVILENRLEIIVKLPQKNLLSNYTTKVTAEIIEETLIKIRQYLPDVTRTSQINQLSQQLYQWLIQPLELDLARNKVETLVFVLDGSLRNIPMSVLYDAQQEQYLIEKYAIAIAPSLQLIEPKALENIKLNSLIGGVDRARLVEGKEFAPLTYVEPELRSIASKIPKSEALFNQQFTLENLRQQLELGSFSIVHLASHGEFSSNLEKTFILTWNKLLQVKDFAALLQTKELKTSQDIELLVLSACQTATGDKQAGLGLAGIAVQAGARSTLATLWSIDDSSTTNIMSNFYSQLNQNTTKAKALQQAQLNLLAQEKRPYFWAAYVLIGNWL